MLYKVILHNRNSTKWTYYDFDNFKEVELPMEPFQLFSNDVFEWTEEKGVNVVKSSLRSCTDIPGILVLKGTRTYGRDEKGRLLYKCIPDDVRIPCFLIPYQINEKEFAFSKVMENRYVTFQFQYWSKEIPHGIVKQNLGPTSGVWGLQSYYEYQLYCKSLNASIQTFTKNTTKALQKKKSLSSSYIEEIQTRYRLEDRTHWNTIFTVDPDSSVDFDDAVSLQNDEEKGVTTLSIYISNVSIWMDTLNLWESFSRRISTIYLPDRKRPMLPTILSDGLCSLQSGNTRFALTMDIHFDTNSLEIQNIEYKNTSIRVYKNYRYEESALLRDPLYQEVFGFVTRLSKKYIYFRNIRDSHDVIAYLMIFMNYKTAQRMKTFQNGIFRSVYVKGSSSTIPDHLPEDVAQFMKMWNSSSAEYVDLFTSDKSEALSEAKDKSEEAKEKRLNHDVLKMEAYIHITSPIRRLVDLLNLIQVQRNERLGLISEEMDIFYKKWVGELDYINVTMRAIRRVQNDCALLSHCMEDKEVRLRLLYEGYIFDKVSRGDGLFQYAVYLPNLKMVSRIVVREELDNYGVHKFKLYLFENEDKLKKKIRVQILQEDV